MSTTEIVLDRAPSERVIETIAAREGVDPIDLDEPLYTAIDTDALDALVEAADPDAGRSPVHVEFRYHGYDVTVTADGDVHLSRSIRSLWR